LDGLQQLATDSKVWKAFRSRRRLHLATDGGLSAQKGTHGWIISTGTTSLFQCSGPVDGPLDTSSSTRSELAGYASALLLIRALSAFWQTRHKSKFHWYCDSKSAISRVRKYALRRSILTRMPQDADLISIIRSCHRDLRCTIRSHWVKGHQDSAAKAISLPLSSRLNIIADSLATLYRTTGRLKPSPKCHHEAEQRCSLSINGSRLSSQYDESIRFHINGYHLRQHLQRKQGWSDNTWKEVDFYTFGQHFRRLRPQSQAKWMKIVHNQLPLGDRRYLQSHVKDPLLRLCPCCKILPETMSHFLTCNHNVSWTASLQSLKTDICGKDGHPVCHILYSGLHHFYSKQAGPYNPHLEAFPVHLHTTIRDALDSQAQIGWCQATKGFLSSRWRDLAAMAMFQSGVRDETKGNIRLRNIVNGIYEHSLRLWKARNEMLHNKTDGDLLRVRSSETAEIISIYAKPELLRFSDRYLCSRPLEKLLSSAPSTRRRWLRRVKFSRALQDREGARQSLITAFYSQSS
jgi:ribonuclease HI